MRKLYLVLLSLLACTFVFAQNKNYGIIPMPNSIQERNGFFKLDQETAIIFNTAEDRKSAELFRDLVKSTEGIELVIAKNFIQKPKTLISFNSSPDFKDEAYRLTISADQILIEGKAKGVFYGTQSLSQLYLANRLNENKLPQLLINDEPRFAYRGMHLDVGRHLFPVSFIKKYIDLMAMYKLNNFHWHLTEDQGWRLEIKKYPKLTEIGAYRKQTVIGNYHQTFPRIYDGVKYGGFYTQEEAREVVAYAASKYINVIPEIELPGHSLAVLTAYPELACGKHPGPFKVAEMWGVFPDIYCAGKEETFHFLEDVLTEVLDIFPSKFIHIGGDEAPKDRWKTCEFCQKRIKHQKLKDEHELQSYFIHRMEKFLNKKGRDIIGWDEILEGGLAPNATVMSWRGEKGGIEAARQKHNVIMTPSNQGLYFDHIQGRTDQEPTTIGGNGFIERVYNYNPASSALTAEQQQYVIGVQANLWTEYIPTSNKVEYMLLPRLMALSEIAWTQIANKNYKNFNEDRLPMHLAELDKQYLSYRVPEVIGAKDTSINVTGSYDFKWKAPVVGAHIYYTIDGSNPDETAMLYKGDLTVNVPKGESREVKSIAITQNNRRGKIVATKLFNRDAFEAQQPAFTLTKGSLKYYYIPGKFTTTLELDTNTATQKGTVDAINLAKIKNKAREYGLVYTGYINVNEDATFEFSLSSNDGSRLYIDDEQIIENDGRIFQYERSAGVPLKKGLHKIRITYFDNGPASALKFYVKGTDNKKIELPSVMMFN
ncbi:family 20 glycosylhydrolase [Pseudopedobacter beijingensis]|uniref:beta-N-acetylhexosaminidase n=1 Tax=Pseudopedobacter beijingensis TaxID=1207056 RepID=A0ABW4IDX1_9SPHI